MDIQEFRSQLLAELREKSESEGTSLPEQFLTKALDELEIFGELKEPIPMSVRIAGRRGRLMGFDAYAYDEADSALVLIACDFREDEEGDELMTRTRIGELCRRMAYFVEESLTGDMAIYADGHRAALYLAREFKEKIGTGEGMYKSEVLRFKFYVLSNAQLSRHMKDLTQEDLLGRPVTLNVWTLERFYQAYMSDVSEAVEFDTVDFGCPGLPCLKANPQEEAPYDSYLCVMPGRMLADLYLRYGSRLLQSNVRAFLSLRGKVNKGIRRTIMDEPENFFIYNNGISVVARSADFRGNKIVHLRDFQIINGGQTTASLANAVIRKEARNGMDALFVPMKLTVVNVGDDMTEEEAERYFNLTKRISQCANSQNAVSDADFFSNHPYHTTMEALSRKVLAPPAEGSTIATTWFYERSRGKWEQEQMKFTPAEQKRYREEHPKKQVIKKEKLARCLSAFAKKAHRACEASAQCFKHFASDIDDLWDTQHDSINEEYFKKCVCMVIVFDAIDSMVGAAPWYPRNGTKTDIVAYAIAKLMTLIPAGRDIDWVTIWKRQRIYPALADELYDIAREAHEFLTKTAAGRYAHIVAKTEPTWTDFQKARWTLSEEFLCSLVSLNDQKVVEQQAKRAHRFNANVDNQVEIFKLGARYWMEVYNALRSERILSTGDVELIRNIATQISGGRLPISSQCKRLMKVIEKAEDGGYLMPTPPES